jgi:flagellar L-ring protein precursor FlgH
MRKSKTTNLSCLTKAKERAPRPAPVKLSFFPPGFSIYDFKFATPRSLRALLRLAAAFLVLALPMAQAGTGSLWKEESSRSMVSDKRARAVGDIITIVVQENAAATKENSTKTSKSAGVDASLNTVLFSPAASGFLTKQGQLPALKYSSKSDFDGGGKINNSERITARIAVRVADVLPNGNMLVEGRRDTSFSGEKQEAILRGLVRSEDLMANNTVFSYNVADASIQFKSKGTITDAQRKGWFTRVWDKLTPF